MWQDEIITELRQIREAYAKEHGYDIKAMWADWRKKQAQGGRVVVKFPLSGLLK